MNDDELNFIRRRHHNSVAFYDRADLDPDQCAMAEHDIDALLRALDEARAENARLRAANENGSAFMDSVQYVIHRSLLNLVKAEPEGSAMAKKLETLRLEIEAMFADLEKPATPTGTSDAEPGTGDGAAEEA